MTAIASRRRLVDYRDLSDHEKKNLAILETVRRRAPLARAEIARLTEFNIVTVTSYVDQYIKKEILREVGVDISSGGRKPALIDLNTDSAFAVGVGLNAVEINAVLCNLKGEVVSTVTAPRPMESGEKVIDCMVNLVEELLKKKSVQKSSVHGVGVGFPGILNRKANTVRWPMGLGNRDLSVSLSLNEKFQRKLGLSVIVDNDANTAVFGEQWFAEALNIEDAIYLYSGAGIGVLIDGKIYRGHSGSAGEWVFDMEREHPEKWVQQSINSGSWALDLGISARAQEELKDHPKSKLNKACGGDVSKINLKTVIDAAQASDEFAIKLLGDAGRVLGRKAALLVNLLNPELVIVGGGLEQGGIYFLNAVSQEIKKCSVPEATEKLKVVPSQLSENCVALGAAALVIQSYFVGG